MCSNFIGLFVNIHDCFSYSMNNSWESIKGSWCLWFISLETRWAMAGTGSCVCIIDTCFLKSLIHLWFQLHNTSNPDLLIATFCESELHLCAGASPSSPTRGFLFWYLYGAPLENIQMPNERTEPASKPESAPRKWLISGSVQPFDDTTLQ